MVLAIVASVAVPVPVLTPSGRKPSSTASPAELELGVIKQARRRQRRRRVAALSGIVATLAVLALLDSGGSAPTGQPSASQPFAGPGAVDSSAAVFLEPRRWASPAESPARLCATASDWRLAAAAGDRNGHDRRGASDQARQPTLELLCALARSGRLRVRGVPAASEPDSPLSHHPGAQHKNLGRLQFQSPGATRASQNRLRPRRHRLHAGAHHATTRLGLTNPPA
jgi:hypothetical protein